MKTSEPIFSLFACCIPVKGARRSVICDLQRNSFRFIPNDLFKILVEHRGRTLSDIKAAYNNECDAEIDEYFDFLISEEFGFWCQDPDNFPPLDLSWEPPERISNAIIDIDAESEHDLNKIFEELDDLGCKALEVRFFCACKASDLRKVLEYTRFGRLRSIHLLAGYTDDLRERALEELGTEFPRVSSFVIHSAPEVRRVDLEGIGVTVHYRTEIIDSPACCGKVHPGYFIVNIETFAEAQKHNTCLNRKIAVDVRGDIRNCPSLPKTFGNSRQVSLHSALAQRDFKELWLINKDSVEVCKDCEFRYICTDCRAYLVDKDDQLSKPRKCNYDPYTAEWNPVNYGSPKIDNYD